MKTANSHSLTRARDPTPSDRFHSYSNLAFRPKIPPIFVSITLSIHSPYIVKILPPTYIDRGKFRSPIASPGIQRIACIFHSIVIDNCILCEENTALCIDCRSSQTRDKRNYSFDFSIETFPFFPLISCEPKRISIPVSATSAALNDSSFNSDHS